MSPAFAASLPVSTSRVSSTPSRCPSRAAPRASAARKPAAEVPPAPLKMFEEFLQAGHGRPEDADVFLTADGGLVCEWTPALAHAAALRKYEHFLQSEEAEGVDITKPVTRWGGQEPLEMEGKDVEGIAAWVRTDFLVNREMRQLDKLRRFDAHT